MPGSLYDLVKFTSTTVGTGPVTVGAAVAPYATPASAGIPDGTTVEYTINDGLNSEKGLGVTGSLGATMSRNVTAAFVNGVKQTTPISLSGSASVYIDPSAEGLQAPLSLLMHATLGGI